MAEFFIFLCMSAFHSPSVAFCKFLLFLSSSVTVFTFLALNRLGPPVQC